MSTLGNINIELPIFYKKSSLPKLTLGSTVCVTIYLDLPKEVNGEGEKKGKERIQTYEGVIIAKHKSIDKNDATITVRKMFQGGGIEKVFVIHSPWVKEIKVIRNAKIRRAKLYYLRERTGKSARLKQKF